MHEYKISLYWKTNPKITHECQNIKEFVEYLYNEYKTNPARRTLFNTYTGDYRFELCHYIKTGKPLLCVHNGGGSPHLYILDDTYVDIIEDDQVYREGIYDDDDIVPMYVGVSYTDHKDKYKKMFLLPFSDDITYILKEYIYFDDF